MKQTGKLVFIQLLTEIAKDIIGMKIPRFNTTFMKRHLNQREEFSQQPDLVTIGILTAQASRAEWCFPPSHRYSS